MVGAVTNYQKPLAIRKIKRRKAGESAMREIRKLKKNSEHFVNRVPYKHLLREFSSQMSTLMEEEAVTRKSVNILHQASQAYLSGIFADYSNVCQKVAKRESSSFLLYLASLGLKNLVSKISEDKDIANAAKESSYHFHDVDHFHNDIEWNDLPNFEASHHHHNHNDLPHIDSDDSDDSDASDTSDERDEERSNNNTELSEIMRRVMSRISENVTVTVLREDQDWEMSKYLIFIDIYHSFLFIFIFIIYTVRINRNIYFTTPMLLNSSIRTF